MTWQQRLLASFALLLIVAVSGYFYGKSTVQTAWDLEKARMDAVSKQVMEQNESTIKALKDKHLKEVAYAKSEAGRIAVNRWIREHGLLQPTNDSSQAKSASTSNEASCKCGIGSSLEEFTLNCGLDALQVEGWQEWAIREGLEVE